MPDIYEVPYKKGDRFVLCTDGLWGSMPEKELIAALGAKTEMASLVNNIASTVDRRGMESGGGHDNHTMAIIEMDNNSKAKEGMDKSTKIVFAVLCGILTVSVVCNIVLMIRLGSDDYTSVIDQQNRTIEELGKYKIRYNELLGNGNKDFAEAVSQYYVQKDSLEEVIASLKKERDSLKAAGRQKKPDNTSAASPELGKALIAMKSLRDYKNTNMQTTLKEKDKYRKQALDLLKRYKERKGKSASATVNSICDKLNDKVIVEIMKDKDNKYISTKRAMENIDKIIERANTLK